MYSAQVARESIRSSVGWNPLSDVDGGTVYHNSVLNERKQWEIDSPPQRSSSCNAPSEGSPSYICVDNPSSTRTNPGHEIGQAVENYILADQRVDPVHCWL